MYESGMSKTAKVLFFIIVGLMAYFLITLGGCGRNPYQVPLEIADSSGNIKLTLYVEEADTPAKAEKGLMFRESMPENAGMIFHLTEPRVFKMWMKNTLIPLDMLFYDENGVIVEMVEGAKPLDLTVLGPDYPVKGVIEVNAGIVQKYNLSKGDHVKSLKK